MWTCSKCNRTFKNQNQSHYCGNPTTIQEYIETQDEEVQPILQQVHETIRKAAPKASERLSWQMPTYWQKENIIHFAAFKKHISIFPGSRAIEEFHDKLKEYRVTKGTIQFPLSREVPFNLIHVSQPGG